MQRAQWRGLNTLLKNSDAFEMQSAELLLSLSLSLAPPSSRLLVAYTLIKTPDTIRRRKEPQRRFPLFTWCSFAPLTGCANV